MGTSFSDFLSRVVGRREKGRLRERSYIRFYKVARSGWRFVVVVNEVAGRERCGDAR